MMVLNNIADVEFMFPAVSLQYIVAVWSPFESVVASAFQFPEEFVMVTFAEPFTEYPHQLAFSFTVALNHVLEAYSLFAVGDCTDIIGWIVSTVKYTVV